MPFNDFKKELKNFISLMRYHYSKLEYISAIESYEEFNHWHAHIVFVFSDTKPQFSRDWLKKNWKHGLVNIRHANEFDENGFIYYITKYKLNNLQDENLDYTKFPANSKFINASRNLPRYGTKQLDDDADNFMVHKIFDIARDSEARININKHYFGEDKYQIDYMFVNNIDIDKIERFIDDCDCQVNISDEYMNTGEIVF